MLPRRGSGTYHQSNRRQSYGNRYQGNVPRRGSYNGTPRQNQYPTNYGASTSTGATVGGAFFLGNIDKALTREAVYDFIRNQTPCYISKFDMPNVSGREQDPQGRPIRCAGFAFVHVRNQWMADEMLAMGTIKIGALSAEIKPYDQAKRMMSERRHRESMSRQRYESQKDDDDPAPSTSYLGDAEPEISHVGAPDDEDWAIEEDPMERAAWRQSSPVDWNIKIGKYTSMHEESAYQTEEDSISHVSQPVGQLLNVNPIESYGMGSYSHSRAQTPSLSAPNAMPTYQETPEHVRVETPTRSRPSPLRTEPDPKPPQESTSHDSVASTNALMVGAVTKELLDEGVTPTIERINMLVAKRFRVTEPVVRVKEDRLDTQSAIERAAREVENRFQGEARMPPVLLYRPHGVSPACPVAQVTTQSSVIPPVTVPVCPVPMSRVSHPHLQPITEQLQNHLQPVNPQTMPAQPTNTTLFTDSPTYASLRVQASQILHQHPNLAQQYQLMFNTWSNYYQAHVDRAFVDIRLTEAQQVERMRQTINGLVPTC